MTWIDYMIMAAKHSKGNARHWFRYLSKYIDKCGTVFTHTDVDILSTNEALSLFQRVTLNAAFKEGSLTRQHILAMNQPATFNMVANIRARLIEDKG